MLSQIRGLSQGETISLLNQNMDHLCRPCFINSANLCVCLGHALMTSSVRLRNIFMSRSYRLTTSTKKKAQKCFYMVQWLKLKSCHLKKIKQPAQNIVAQNKLINWSSLFPLLWRSFQLKVLVCMEGYRSAWISARSDGLINNKLSGW